SRPWRPPPVPLPRRDSMRRHSCESHERSEVFTMFPVRDRYVISRTAGSVLVAPPPPRPAPVEGAGAEGRGGEGGEGWRGAKKEREQRKTPPKRGFSLREKRLVRASENRFDPLPKLVLRQGADLGRRHLPVLEQHQGRNAAHTVLLRRLRILVDIH